MKIYTNDNKILISQSGDVYSDAPISTQTMYGKYRASQINYMITVLGYIPVSTISEFDSITVAGSKTMGSGSPWSGTYYVDATMKYVQLFNLNGNNLSRVINTFTGTYDGSNLLIYNVALSGSGVGDGVFKGLSSTTRLRNIKLTATSSVYNVNGCALLSGRVVSGAIIEDCFVSGTMVTTYPGGKSNTGGICYSCQGTIRRCVSNVNLNSGFNSNIGGITGTVETGGLIENCYAIGNVTATTRAGGLVGTNSGTVRYCYSYGRVTGTSSGGLIALNSGGTVTNSYWDTVTSTQATSPGGGTAKTSTQLKEGFIPDSTVFVGWSPYIWNANSLTEYPTLK